MRSPGNNSGQSGGQGGRGSAPRQAGFEVARTGDAVYVRVFGLGSMVSAPTLKTFVDAMLRESFRRFVIDLERCKGVDSTFMGTLLDVATTAREGSRGNAKGQTSDEDAGVVLVNVDEHCRKQLESVGLDAFVPIHSGATALPPGIELHPLEVRDVAAPERVKLMLRAHQELMSVDARNREKFGPFLEGLLAELGGLGPEDLREKDDR